MKRLLALLLAVCMLSAVPTAVFAEGSNKDLILSYETNGDFLATATVSFSHTGSASIMFSGDNLIYNLSVSTDKITLSDSDTVFQEITTVDAYKNGIKIVPNQTYIIAFQAYKGEIKCYIDGALAIEHTHPTALGSGTVTASCLSGEGNEITSFTVTEPEFIDTWTITDASGNEITSLDVPVGNTPDFIGLALNLTYTNGKTKTVQLDSTAYSQVDCSTEGRQTAVFEYLNETFTLQLDIVRRTQLIETLNRSLGALDPSAVTLNDKEELYKLSRTYDDLSAIEKADISDFNKERLEKALKNLEILLFPELKHSKVVFKDTFDTKESDSRYDSSVSVTGDRNNGYWYTQNGRFYQYSQFDEYRSASFAARAILKDKNFEITSVSADVQVIDPNIFLGIDACYGNGDYFEFYITDKTNIGGGNRIQLFKNGRMIASTVETDSEKWFKPGVWYNLRITLADGMVRCYVDDILRLETTNLDPEKPADTPLTTGTVGIRNTEGWGIFDNLTVWGRELPYVSGKAPMPQLTPGKYTDNFEDEVAGTNPSHWIENNKEDKWAVKTDDENKFYNLGNNLTETTQSWLHVFEQDVDYNAKIRATDVGSLANIGIYARVNTDHSFIKGGYDFAMKKWFINVRLGIDFDEVITYAQSESTVNLNQWYNVRLKAVGKELSLYVDGRLVATADAGTKVMPGRVGFFADRCNIDADDIKLDLLSGQGRVEDGVLEYTPTDTEGTHLGMIVLPDGRYWFFSEGCHNISEDKGQTIQNVEGFTDARPTTMVQLPDGKHLHVKNCKDAYLSKDCVTWEKVGELPIDPNSLYAQPGDRINMIQLDNGVYRVFHTVGRQSNIGNRAVVSETYYTDDMGYTWTQSKNSPMEFTNLKYFCETQIIKIKDGPLIQYCSYNDSGCMRYTLSEDNGETWSNEYALPQIPCALGSFSVKEDPFEEGTYYMSTIYMPPYSLGNGRPRHRIALLRSYDGINWEFLADIDRWGNISDGGRAEIMQNVNMNLGFSDEYIFPLFTRSEQYQNNSTGHNIQLQRIYRFEKSKLKPYDVWPKEYYINPKAITNIIANPRKTEYAVGETIDAKDVELLISYYDNSTDLTTVAAANGVITAPDMSTPGRKKVIVDYELFRDVYEIQIGGDGEWANPFVDVKKEDWFEKGVAYAYTEGLTSGTGETEFSPHENLTRAMLVTMLWRAENKPGVIIETGFTDLEEGAYYVDAVKWAALHDIVNGTSNKAFSPDEKITREQIAAIIYRYAYYKGYDVSEASHINLLQFDDYESISPYAVHYMQYAFGGGLITGKSKTTINPRDNATRAEVATILQRFLGE